MTEEEIELRDARRLAEALWDQIGRVQAENAALRERLRAATGARQCTLCGAIMTDMVYTPAPE